MHMQSDAVCVCDATVDIITKADHGKHDRCTEEKPKAI